MTPYFRFAFLGLAITLAGLMLLMFAGCSTLNDVGVGGEPVLVCKFRDGTAYIDDKLLGSEDVHASMMRRFKDVDVLCTKKAS